MIVRSPNSRLLGHIRMPRIAQMASRIAPATTKRMLTIMKGGSTSRL